MSAIFGGASAISSLFGGNNQSSRGSTSSSGSSSSNNQAYPMLSGALTPQVNNATGASNQMANMLGLNGGSAQNEGFNNWKNSTGYQFGLDQGRQAVTGSAASKGLLNSGATGKALIKFGQNYADTQYGNYFSQLLGLGNQGNQAAGTIANAGQQSSSVNQSQGSNSSNGATSSGGLGSAIGSLLSK